MEFAAAGIGSSGMFGKAFQSDFFHGGLALMILAGLYTLMQSFFSQAIWKLYEKFVVSIEVSSLDECFQWILKWLADNKISNEGKILTCQTHRGNNSNQSHHDATASSRKPRLLFTPGPGTHFFRYKGCTIMLYRYSTETQQLSFASTPKESIRLSMFGSDTKILKSFCGECMDNGLQDEEGMVSVFTPDPYNVSNWQKSLSKPKRSLQSVILAGRTSEDVVDDIQKFLNSSEWYKSRGLPYRRGYLLHGPPGNGKSSFLFAIASVLNLNICCLSLNEDALTDSKLANLMRASPSRSLILLEDVDCIFEDRTAKGKRVKITFSGVLNAIDGVAAQEGCLLFLTTNHKEKLSPALIRPGRIDKQVFFGLATAEQTKRLYKVFFPEEPQMMADKFATMVEPNTVSMAKLQGFFLLYRDNPSQCFEHMDELLKEDEDPLTTKKVEEPIVEVETKETKEESESEKEE